MDVRLAGYSSTTKAATVEVELFTADIILFCSDVASLLAQEAASHGKEAIAAITVAQHVQRFIGTSYTDAVAELSGRQS